MEILLPIFAGMKLVPHWYFGKMWKNWFSLPSMRQQDNTSKFWKRGGGALIRGGALIMQNTTFINIKMHNDNLSYSGFVIFSNSFSASYCGLVSVNWQKSYCSNCINKSPESRCSMLFMCVCACVDVCEHVFRKVCACVYLHVWAYAWMVLSVGIPSSQDGFFSSFSILKACAHGGFFINHGLKSKL